MKNGERTNHNLTGAAGEYYVCAELCKLGYLALLTPKNNPLFDVIATSQDGSRTVSIQVKTRSVQNTQGWIMNDKMEDAVSSKGKFVVLVKLQQEGPPDFYIYERAVLAKRIEELYASWIETRRKDGSAHSETKIRQLHERRDFTESDKARKNNWKPI